MSVEYTKKTWYDGSEGGTPITAAELNRVETGIDDVVTQSNADKTKIDNHMASKVNSSSGAHGLRYYDDKFSYYDEINEEWVDAETGADDYEDLTNLPSINGVELLGNKVIGTLSGDIHVDSDKIGYDNLTSGLSATNVKDAIDEVLTKETTVTTDSYGYVITDPKNTHVTIPPASLSGTASMAVKSGTQGKQYTMTDSENHVSADFYTKSAVDELVSGGGGTGNYPDLTNKPSINGVELLGNKLVGLLSTDIHINADKIGYSGTVSGASTTRAAIDALQSSLSGLHSVPSGGNTNQVLAKNSNSDYDLKWVNQTGGGGVGTVINLTTLYSALFNQTVTLTGTYDTYTATFDSTGHATVNVFYVDTYAVTCQGSTDSVTVTAIGLVINADVFSVAVVNLTTPYSALFGQAVTLTGTNATYTTSFDSSGHATVNVLYTDTYTVTCQGLTDSVTVSTLGTVVNATVFEITTVNITTSDSDLIGETISVYYDSDPTDVRASLTFDSNLSVSFQTEDIGTYNIVIGYSNPVSFTVSSIGGSVSVTYNPTPIGSSVTPVNNVRNWLDSAKVFDKNYTTISQVLSDTTTLQTLISSQNANDYLVRSTSWASDICGNSTAMSYIGLNNYSANTLLANSTWLNGIANSAYIESVMNIKVPTMTSDTTPSGECIQSNDGSGAWKAFDGSNTTSWNSSTSNIPAYVGYMFTSAVCVKSFLFYHRSKYSNYSSVSKTITLQASVNGNNWTSLNASITVTPNEEKTFKVSINNNNNYRYYRLYCTNTLYEASKWSINVYTVQFYGRQNV